MSGPPPQEAIDATLQWVREQFREHYIRERDVWLPPRFGRREFGFMWLGKKFFLRHKGFTSRQEVARFLRTEAPSHAYYSTAYYQNPNASTMKEKGWLGADLIFDLDADHLPEVREGKDLTFEDTLVAVRREAAKLLHDFVLGDLGFDEKHVRVVFSGGRGYHIHVDDPRVLTLAAAERREIVDYVTGNGLDATRFRHEVTFQDRDREGRPTNRTKKRVYYDAPDAVGWGGRLSRSYLGFWEEVLSLPRDEARKRLLTLKGVGDKRADQILTMLHADGRGGGRARLEQFETWGVATAFEQHLDARALETLSVAALNDSKGEADEPVTADIKRLIRLPGSLHGKTGLRVTHVPIDDLADFDPLTECVSLGTEPVDVVVSKPEEVRFGSETYRVEPGRQELPLSVAMFLVLRRKALLPW